MLPETPLTSMLTVVGGVCVLALPLEGPELDELEPPAVEEPGFVFVEEVAPPQATSVSATSARTPISKSPRFLGAGTGTTTMPMPKPDIHSANVIPLEAW